MDSKIVNIITCNLVNPYNHRIRIYFTNRAIKLLVETFSHTPIADIEFICFCFKLANYSECLLNDEDINYNLTQVPNIANNKCINIGLNNDNHYSDNIYLLKNENKHIKRYITLSDIYNYFVDIKNNDIDNNIVNHCWNNFISSIKKFDITKDNKYGEVHNLQYSIKNNPVSELLDYIKLLNKH